MAKDRGDRPATTGEFLKELKTALANSEQGIGADHLHSAPSPRTSVETRSDVNAATVVTMGVAGIDLIYVRLSALLCAADRVLPPGDIVERSTPRRRKPTRTKRRT